MKNSRFNYLLMLLGMSGILFFTSCNSDDDGDVTPDAPTITFQGGDLEEENNDTFTGHPGDTLHFNVIVNAPGGFNVLRITKQGGRDFEQQEIVRSQAGQTTLTHAFSYRLSAEEIGDEVVFTFTAVDDADRTSSKTFTITTEEVPEPTVAISEIFLLNSPSGDGSSKTFYSTSTLTKYSKADVEGTSEPLSSEIDFGYAYGVTQKATLAGIANYPGFVGYNFDNWRIKNVTLFKRTNLDVEDFDAITEFDNSAISSAYETEGADSSGQVTDIQAGNVFAFKTDNTKEDGQKFGLIKVVEVMEGTESNKGIRLEIKVIK